MKIVHEKIHELVKLLARQTVREYCMKETPQSERKDY